MDTGDGLLKESDGPAFSDPPPPGQWRVLPVQELEPSKIERALHERIKELNCLYGLAQLAKESPDSLDSIAQRVVNLLPPS